MTVAEEKQIEIAVNANEEHFLSHFYLNEHNDVRIINFSMNDHTAVVALSDNGSKSTRHIAFYTAKVLEWYDALFNIDRKSFGKHIRVDMDYASTPVWFSKDGETFINGDVWQLGISDSLATLFEFYRKLWETEMLPYVYDEDYVSPKSEVLEALRLSLAISLNREKPDFAIYVWDEETSTNRLIY